LERAVTGQVALFVIDSLETIQVQAQLRQRATISSGSCDFLMQALVEGAPVEKPRQRIGRREAGEPVSIVPKHAPEQRESDRRRTGHVRVRRTVGDNLVAHGAPRELATAHQSRQQEPRWCAQRKQDSGKGVRNPAR
jgi:hypothetical protein